MMYLNIHKLKCTSYTLSTGYLLLRKPCEEFVQYATPNGVHKRPWYVTLTGTVTLLNLILMAHVFVLILSYYYIK